MTTVFFSNSGLKEIDLNELDSTQFAEMSVEEDKILQASAISLYVCLFKNKFTGNCCCPIQKIKHFD